MRTLTDFFELPLREVEEIFRIKCKGDISQVIEKAPKGDRDWKGFKEFVKFLGFRGSRAKIGSKVRKKLNRYGIWMIHAQFFNNEQYLTLLLVSNISSSSGEMFPFDTICLIFTKDCKICRLTTAVKDYIGENIQFSYSLDKYLIQ